VPFGAGGSTDIVARVLAQRLETSLGQPVVIENRVGAGGNIGARAVAQAASDGYTLLMGDTFGLATARSLYANVGYDARRDLLPVGLVASSDLVLVVPASSQARTVADLIALGRSKPDAVTYASSGVGTLPHLAGERLASSAGIKMVHVPYRGTAPALTDLLADRISMSFAPIGVALPHIQAGKLRALAVTGAQRARQLPDVPTMTEAGVANFVASQQYGVFAPAGTPAAVVAKLNSAMYAASGEIRDSLARMGLEPTWTPARTHGDILAEQDGIWSKVMRDARIKPN
jgi:tripartite-type tricarboxylate transporter receptor subunit TctC